MRLRALAPGKVNLGLRLGPSRPDGRHELVTVFQSVSLADELTLTIGATGSADEVCCPGVEGDNLAATALRELRQRGWDGPPVRLEIAKRIPVAAGMAGGSADAAAALRLADALQPVAGEVLMEIAAGLGADVPAQLMPGTSLGTGAGELVERLPPPAAHAYLILTQPDHLPTAAVFHEADRLGLPRRASELEPWRQRVLEELPRRPRVPAELLVNDLEAAALSLLPAIGDALDVVRSAGADDAIVCGSGPTVAGIFWGGDAPARAQDAASQVAQRSPQARIAVPVQDAFAAPARLSSSL